MNNKTFVAVAVLSALAVPGTAAAQTTGETAGEIEYQQACASCHGQAGKGDGPVSEYLSVRVPNLTGISARNDGMFPYRDLMLMIDGRNAERQIGAHGIAMPVWGDRFMLDSNHENPVENEINTLGRISSLVNYLYSIQE